MSGFSANRNSIVHYMSPAGGGVDDSTRVQAAANTFAYNGKVVLRAGDWNWETPCTLPSGAWIEGTSGARIISSITATGGPGGYEQSVFRAFIAPAGTTTSITVQADQGDFTLTVAANLVDVGDTILLQPTGVTNVAQILIVTDKSGSGPYVLSLDRPVEFKCLVGSSVQTVTVPCDIVISGNGLEITGTGDRAVEFGAAQNCLVEDLNINASFESIAVSFDIAGYRNTARRIRVFGDDTSASGVALECQVESIIEDCYISNCGNVNAANSSIYVTTSKRFIVRGCVIRKGMNGVDVAYSSSSDEEGCENGIVTDCHITDGLGSGVRVSGSKNIEVSNIICRHNQYGIAIYNNAVRGASNIYLNNIVVEDATTDGLLLMGTNIHAKNVQANSCAAHGVRVSNDNFADPSTVWINGLTSNSNGGHGLFVDGAAGDGGIVYVNNVTTSLNVGAGLKITGSVGGGALYVEGWLSDNDCSAGLEGIWNNTHASGTLSISNSRVRNSVNGVWFGVHAAVGTTVLTNYVAEYLSGTGTKALVDLQAAGTMYLDNVRTFGALTYGIYAGHSTASSVREGTNVDLSSCLTPYVFDSFSTLYRTATQFPASTLTALKAIPSPRNGLIVQVAETDAEYVFDTSSSATANNWTVLSAIDGTTGRWLIKSDTLVFGGSRGDGVRLTNAVMNSASAILTSASAPFTSASVGKKIIVHGAGAAGIALIATISAFNSTSQVTLSATASTSVTSAVAIFGTDVASAMQAGFDATAGSGVSIFLPAGRYVIGTGMIMPTNLHLIGSPSTIISSALVATGTEINNPLGTQNLLGGSSTTLAAIARRGDRTISITANIATVGQFIRVKSIAPEGNNQMFNFKVQAISGSGPYTITLDRPLQFTFIVNSLIDALVYLPENIQIDGNDMTIDGSGDTVIQLWHCFRTNVNRVNVLGKPTPSSPSSFGNWALTSDIGCYRNHIFQLRAVGTNGLAISCNEATTLEQCTIDDSDEHGILMWDGVDCQLLNCRANNSTLQGLNISSNGNQHGSLNLYVFGGNYDCNTYGIIVQAETQGLKIEGVSCKYSKYYGVAIIYASQIIELINCDIGPATQADGGAIQADELFYALPAIYATSGSYVRMRGGRILFDGPTYPVAGAINQLGAVANGSGTVIELLNVDIRMDLLSSGAGNAVGVCSGGGGTIVLDNGTRFYGTQSGGNHFAIITGGTGTVRIGRVDLDAIFVGLRYFGSGYYSRNSTVVSNGAGTSQNVTWPNIKSTDRIEFRLVTSGGTPTPRPPIYTITEGVSFTVTFASGDTSTYEYIIY